MGTSKSLPTPTGGDWTSLKGDIGDFVNGEDTVSADNIVGGAVRAIGGVANLLAAAPRGEHSGGVGRGSGGAGGGGRAGGVGAVSRAGVGGAVSGLGGFGAAVMSTGLGAALDRLGLHELRGKSAVEVIARVAEHLAQGAEGLSQEVLCAALRDSILEAAALESDVSYENLETSLQVFLDREGPEGLVESFLTHLVFDQVWSLIETHVEAKADGATAVEATAVAVENACRAHVHLLIDDTKNDGRFNNMDWFGREGIHLGQDIVSDLSRRLSRLASPEAT